ncbi:MAG: tetratricopeptide repeat protein [bacterium]|nr:tetratricopeptide repeat protein [bacterium]
MLKTKFETNQYLTSLVLLFTILAIFPLNQLIATDRARFVTQQEVFYDTPKQLFFGILGEFRATIADILWVKVDDYFHSAVSAEDHQRIHPEHKDWHPNEPHAHAADADAEFMPLLRLVTWLDPNFMMAYQVGAWWLTYKLDKTEEAVSFLKEAIQHNPNRYEGYYELGWLYHRKLQNEAEAVNWFNAALPHAPQPEVQVMLQATIAAIEENRGNRALATRLWQEIAKTGIEPQTTTAKKRLADITDGR